MTYLAVCYSSWPHGYYKKVAEAEIQASNDAELVARLHAWMESLGLDPADDDDQAMVNWIPLAV